MEENGEWSKWKGRNENRNCKTMTKYISDMNGTDWEKGVGLKPVSQNDSSLPLSVWSPRQHTYLN